jgi:paraquat-inducible protein A
MNKKKIAATLVLLSCLAFGMALVFPLFSIRPTDASWTGLIKLLASDQFAYHSFTLIGGIISLWKENEYLLAFIMGLISLVFPVIKLSALWWEIFQICSLPQSFLEFTKAASRYAMAEVLLIALFILAVKDIPGITEVKIQAGTWYFTISVILSFLASRWAYVSKCMDNRS